MCGHTGYTQGSAEGETEPRFASSACPTQPCPVADPGLPSVYRLVQAAKVESIPKPGKAEQSWLCFERFCPGVFQLVFVCLLPLQGS